MDLLGLIYAGNLSVDEAQTLFDSWNEKYHAEQVSAQWYDEFELSEYEATAYLHGADLGDLVKLRYDGWPTSCVRCELPLEYKDYGWFFVRDNRDMPNLVHIGCLPMYLRPRSRRQTTIKKITLVLDRRLPRCWLVMRNRFSPITEFD